MTRDEGPFFELDLLEKESGVPVRPEKGGSSLSARELLARMSTKDEMAGNRAVHCEKCSLKEPKAPDGRRKEVMQPSTRLEGTVSLPEIAVLRLKRTKGWDEGNDEVVRTPVVLSSELTAPSPVRRCVFFLVYS